MRRSIFFALGWAVLAGPVSADSDGYFCVSTGYVAYELREWSAPEKHHVLRIVRVGSTGIEDPVTTQLDDFQVHGMTCRPDEVLIVGWDREYLVTVPGSGQAKLARVTSRTDHRIPVDQKAGKLSAPARSQSMVIPTIGKGRTFELQIEHHEVVAGSVHHVTVVRVVERNDQNQPVSKKELHRSEFEETVD